MLLSIDKSKKETIFDQLVNQIKSLIESGDLQEGFQMPSTRQLGVSLGVNRSTVIRAYEELWALGYIESTPGSYTKIRKRKGLSKEILSTHHRESFWDELLTGAYKPDYDKLKKFSQMVRDENEHLISFNRLEPDSRLIDVKLINTCIREAMANSEHNIFGYCNPRGYEPLRRSIISHMRLHGVNAGDENILITNGSQNSLQLIFQAFISKDDYVAAESPTYSMLIPLIKYYRCKILEIPVTESGMDIDVFERFLHKYPVKMVYTMPTFHNPTSVTLSQGKREQLLSLCEKHKVIIVEDSIEEEMKYFGKVHLPIKSIDSHGVVIYLGSFSKILAPGFRIGWIIADKECVNRLTALKTIFDLSTNTFSQIVLYRFCKSGYYELHIRKFLRIFRKRMKAALKALKTYMPADKVTWQEPLGGFLIWLRLNVKADKVDLEDHFQTFGVKIIDGNSFFYNPPNEHYVRLSISKCNEEEIEEGVKRMVKAIEVLE
ncbi:MAG: PLP-dependent aminotransferase family protein [Bacteroidales bacterium]|nr:MAG: PLP-dependent aminotransferase family protein [Bacteroidales bacterium]